MASRAVCFLLPLLPSVWACRRAYLCCQLGGLASKTIYKRCLCGHPRATTQGHTPSSLWPSPPAGTAARFQWPASVGSSPRTLPRNPRFLCCDSFTPSPRGFLRPHVIPYAHNSLLPHFPCFSFLIKSASVCTCFCFPIRRRSLHPFLFLFLLSTHVCMAARCLSSSFSDPCLSEHR